MHGYCLNVFILGSFLLHIGIMNLEFCLCRSDIFKSRFVPIEGQIYLKIHRRFLVCVRDNYCCLLLTAFGVCARELLLSAADCFLCVCKIVTAVCW